MKYYTPLQGLEDAVISISENVMKEKEMIDEIISLYRHAHTYTVENNNGLVDTYHYFMYPFKGLTLVNSRLYALLGKYLGRMIPQETEVIVTIEADGIGIAHFVGAEANIPVIISKHFHYNVDCIELTQQAGYHKRQMYLPKAIQGKNIAIVDCMVSTGGTVKALVSAIESLPETTITGIFVVNDKNNYRSTEKTLCGYPYKYLIDASVTPQGVVEANWSIDLRTVFWEMMDEQFFSITEHASHFSSVSKRGYQVGSIIVDAETFEILSWGFRRGNLHAEQDAISMLKHNCPDWERRKLTIYSTMEPCIYRNDKGQRSCAEHIADLTNCKWVVIGKRDVTDEKIDGEGMKYLVSQGKCVRLIETDEIMRPEKSEHTDVTPHSHTVTDAHDSRMYRPATTPHSQA